MDTPSSSVRILHLDDNPSDAKLIKALIEVDNLELPASVESVFTKEAYLTALHSGTFDVILSDHRMSGYDGDEALRDAKAICPDVPFIMVTGELGEERAVETLKAGATDYVLKDGMRRLVPSINRALKDAQLEQERRETTTRLIEAQRIAHIGNWEWNIQTGEVHWSAEIFSIYGVDPAVFVPTIDAFAQFVHPDDREFVNGKIKEILDRGVSVSFDFRIIASDGSDHVLHTVGEIKRCDAQGKPLVMAGTNQDITERKRWEEELRESEERLRVIQEASLDGFTILRPIRDEKGQIVDFTWVYENAAVARMNGTDPQAVVGRRLLDLFPGHRDTRFFEAYRQVADTGRPMEFEDHYQGETITEDTWFRLVVVPAGDCIATLAQDITAKKRAEEAQRSSEERLKSVLTSSRDVVYRVNLHTGKYEYISPSAEETVGYSAEELMALDSESALSMIHPDDLPRMRAALASLEDTGRAAAEYRQRAKDGTYRWLSNHMALLRDSTGRSLYRSGNIRDITERKRAEAVLKASEENLHLMVNEASDAMAVLDADGTIQAVSRLGAKLLGYEEAELIGKHVQEFAATFSRLEVALKLEDLRAHGQRAVTTSMYVKSKAGTAQMLSLRVRIVYPGTNAEKYLVKFDTIDLPSSSLR